MKLDLTDYIVAREINAVDRRIARRQWHRWYAWRPVKVDGILVWLEALERRLVATTGACFGYDVWPMCAAWEYRLSPLATQDELEIPFVRFAPAASPFPPRSDGSPW